MWGWVEFASFLVQGSLIAIELNRNQVLVFSSIFTKKMKVFGKSDQSEIRDKVP